MTDKYLQNIDSKLSDVVALLQKSNLTSMPNYSPVAPHSSNHINAAVDGCSPTDVADETSENLLVPLSSSKQNLEAASHSSSNAMHNEVSFNSTTESDFEFSSPTIIPCESPRISLN